jgi:deoxyribodipyrimidine photo-lyase
MGAEYFESLLVDYDPCSNYGNWNYLAGVGSDPRENRHFNILNQTRQYDTEGKYIKHWVPELSSLPIELLFAPFQMSKENQFKFGVILGKDYPEPVLDFDWAQS